MAVRNQYREGDYLVKCDRCHMTRYWSQCRFTWDNLLVCGPCWMPRHPQDFVHGIPDDQTVPVARPTIPSTMGETTLTSAALKNDTTIDIPATAGLVDKDPIGIVLDDGTVHWTFIDGAPRGAYLFDGTDDSINAGSDATVDNFFDNGGTIIAWVRSHTLGALRRYIVTKSTFTAAWSFYLANLSGTVMDIRLTYGFSGNTGQWQPTTPAVILNTWTHVAVTYNNQNVANHPIFYIHGGLVPVTQTETPVGTRNTDAAFNLRIGQDSLNITFTFDGLISQVRCYNRILTATEILNSKNGIAVSTQGLKGEWLMTSETNGATPDNSGNSNNGTVSGAIRSYRITLGSYLPGAAAAANVVYLPSVNSDTYITATTPVGL